MHMFTNGRHLDTIIECYDRDGGCHGEPLCLDIGAWGALSTIDEPDGPLR